MKTKVFKVHTCTNDIGLENCLNWCSAQGWEIFQIIPDPDTLGSFLVIVWREEKP